MVRIIFIAFWYRLDDLLLSKSNNPYTTYILRLFRLGSYSSIQRGKRLRLALETLGPVFIKFGQVLSTRRDLIPEDIIDELTLLQDQVPPFPSEQSVKCIEESLGKKTDHLFLSFDLKPVASASISQVHFAVLHDGREVAVKVLRPGMLNIIEKDIALLRMIARIIELFGSNIRRLRPCEVVSEFDKYLHNELDLMKEAANCSQFRRNFGNGSGRENMLIIPEVIWEYTRSNVFTMERMHGIPVGQIKKLCNTGINTKILAQMGVEIFFTQVFSDGFFHADMHPGNIYISNNPRTFGQYIALDFGIIGSLSTFDKNYLAQNFLAFFHRDYRRVAQLHIESGWAPSNTREEELEGAIRSVCEPYFDRSLSKISLGHILLRLFQISRSFNIEIQPQLILLQKTLLNVEGLGRQLDPDLDLWKTAKPYLENWMQERIGWKGFCQSLIKEATQWPQSLPTLPRLIYSNLNRPDLTFFLLKEVKKLYLINEQSNRFIIILIWIISIVVMMTIFS